MGRTVRNTAPGHYHVYCRGNNRRAIFLDDVDRANFLARLARVLRRHRWKLHLFVLMTNHFHLLVETADETLPNGMQRLNLGTARAFNRRYGMTGHLFEAPYGSVAVTRPGYALWLIRYLVLNPVNAGLCRRPEDWPWSSYGATIGLRPAPSFLTMGWILGLFADDLELAREHLRAVVDGTRSR
jgi:putative transposase